jgi:hypothetical protein
MLTKLHAFPCLYTSKTDTIWARLLLPVVSLHSTLLHSTPPIESTEKRRQGQLSGNWGRKEGRKRGVHSTQMRHGRTGRVVSQWYRGIPGRPSPRSDYLSGQPATRRLRNSSLSR